MKFESYRSGSNSGIACGPVCGPFFRESMFYDSEGNSFFVLASRFDCSLMVSVSDYSLFDIEYNAFNTCASNIDNEMDESNKLKKKEYEFNVDDEDTNYGKIFSGYEKDVNFAVKILLKDFDGELTKRELEKLLGEDI